MNPGWCSPSALAALPWLADLVPAGESATVSVHCGGTPAISIVTAARQIGRRRELALELGRGAELGIDIVNSAVNALLASGALPRIAMLHVITPRSSELAVAVVSGMTRACRGHDVPIMVPVAAETQEREHIGLVLVGGVVAARRAVLSAGDVILGLRASGPTDEDFPALQAAASRVGLGCSDRLTNGDLLGATLLAPRKSHFAVVQQPLREVWPGVLLDVGPGGLIASLRRVLPAGLEVDWNFNAWESPAPFAEAWLADGSGLRSVAERTSAGCGMLVVGDESTALRWQQLCSAWNEPAIPIGRLVVASQ